MPYGFPGFGSRQPAPQRLTLEELLGLNYSPPPVQRPAPITSLRDLEGDDRSRAQQESLWAGLAALGTGLNGNWQGAARGIGDIQAAQQGVIGDANQRNEIQYRQQAEQQAAELAAEKKQQEASAIYGMYEDVVEGESDAFAAKAERAAKAGSMAELAQLRDQKPQRASARAKGYDPDAWETNQRLQEELAAELEAQRIKSLTPVKAEERRTLGGVDTDLAVTQQERVGEVKTAQEIAEEEAMRDKKLKGYAPPVYEPLDRVFARERGLQGIRAEYAEKKAVASGGRLYKQGEKIVMAFPPTKEFPNGRVQALDGQPESVGNFVYFSVDGVRYVQDKERPEMGAYVVPLNDEEKPLSELLNPFSDVQSGSSTRTVGRPAPRPGAARAPNPPGRPAASAPTSARPAPRPSPPPTQRPADSPVNAYESLPPNEQTAISLEAEKQWKRLSSEEKVRWGGFTSFVGAAYKRRAAQLGAQ